MTFNISLSNFNATLPGKLLPPCKKLLDIFKISLDVIMLKKDFIFILDTTLKEYVALSLSLINTHLHKDKLIYYFLFCI